MWLLRYRYRESADMVRLITAETNSGDDVNLFQKRPSRLCEQKRQTQIEYRDDGEKTGSIQQQQQQQREKIRNMATSNVGSS